MDQSTAFPPLPVRSRLEGAKQILLMTAVVALVGFKIELLEKIRISRLRIYYGPHWRMEANQLVTSNQHAHSFPTVHDGLTAMSLLYPAVL